MCTGPFTGPEIRAMLDEDDMLDSEVWVSRDYVMALHNA